MQKNRYALGIVLSFSCLFTLLLKAPAAQAGCPTYTDASSNCANGNGPLTSNTTVSSGQTYWYTGTGSVSNINLNGGRIRVCGNLTINGLNFNSGFVTIESTGSLSLSGTNFNLNAAHQSFITNRGTLNISGNLQFQGQGLYVVNLSLMIVTGTIFVNDPNSGILNVGQIISGGLALQNGAGNRVCLKGGSCFQVNGNITADVTNAITYESGNNNAFGTLSYSGNANINNTVTHTNSVAICKQTGATQTGNGSWGTTSVFTNCAGCTASVLPVELVSFAGSCKNREYNFQWSTASELNNARFDLEISANASQWKVYSSVAGAIRSAQPLNYQTSVAASDVKNITDGNTALYARLKQVDLDGKFTTSSVIEVKACESSVKTEVYPNPVSNTLNIRSTQRIAGFDLISSTGSVVASENIESTLEINHSVIDVAAGMYQLKIRYENGDQQILKVIKL